MAKIDAFSYKLGAADCFCEMVQTGVKQIALGPSLRYQGGAGQLSAGV